MSFLTTIITLIVLTSCANSEAPYYYPNPYHNSQSPNNYLPPLTSYGIPLAPPLKLQSDACFCLKFTCVPSHSSPFSQRLTDVEIFNHSRNVAAPAKYYGVPQHQQPLKYTEAIALNQPARVYGVPDRVKREANCAPCPKIECVAVPLRNSELAYNQPQNFYGVPGFNGRIHG